MRYFHHNAVINCLKVERVCIYASGVIVVLSALHRSDLKILLCWHS